MCVCVRACVRACVCIHVDKQYYNRSHTAIHIISNMCMYVLCACTHTCRHTDDGAFTLCVRMCVPACMPVR